MMRQSRSAWLAGGVERPWTVSLLGRPTGPDRVCPRLAQGMSERDTSPADARGIRMRKRAFTSLAVVATAALALSVGYQPALASTPSSASVADQQTALDAYFGAEDSLWTASSTATTSLRAATTTPAASSIAFARDGMAARGEAIIDARTTSKLRSVRHPARASPSPSSTPQRRSRTAGRSRLSYLRDCPATGTRSCSPDQVPVPT